MSDRIEWVEARTIEAEPDYAEDRGVFTDAFGNVNDGPSIRFGRVVVEGTREELREWAKRVLSVIPQGDE